MAVAALPSQAGACTSGAARGLASSKLALRGRHLQAPHRPTQSRAWRTERGGSAPRLVVRARRREQMEDSKSPYEVLGVAPTAGARDIKRAYRQKVKSVHPDVARDSSPETIASFLELQRAYEVLSSPESRRRFDAGEMSARWAERAAMTRAAAQKDLARERVRRARLERERQAEMEANLIRSITWLMIAWPLSYILAFAVQMLMPADVHRTRHVSHFGSVTASRAAHTTYSSTSASSSRSANTAVSPSIDSAYSVTYH